MIKKIMFTTILVSFSILSEYTSANTDKATSPDKSIIIKAVNPTKKATFRFSGGFGFNFNEVTAKEGNKFLAITIESTFPKGAKEIEMMEFYIRSKGKEARTFLLTGYTFAKQEFFFDINNGILAICFPNGTMQSDFKNVMPGNGRVQLINEGGHPGGKSEIRLLFEVPETISNVEVLRGKIDTAK